MRSERIVVYLKSYLGDAVMVAPVLVELAKNFEQVHVFTSKGAAAVLKGLATNIRFHESRNLKSVQGMATQVVETRRLKAEAAIIINRSFSSSLAAKLAGIPVRVGHSTENRKSLLTEYLPYDAEQPETESYAELAQLIGVEVTDLIPKLFLSRDEKERGRKLLGEATVGIQPGARYPDKQIPMHTMVEFTGFLISRELHIAMMGGVDEKHAAEALSSHIRETLVDLVGRCTIRETMGALANLKIMVGADTGVMHLAAGVGCPTLTVFGPTSPNKWGHEYGHHKILYAPGGEMKDVTGFTLMREFDKAYSALDSMGFNV